MRPRPKLPPALLLRLFESRRRPRKPLHPTQAAPGSPEKIAVMADRVSRGESCFHPQDAPLSRFTIQAGTRRNGSVVREGFVRESPARPWGKYR